MQTAGGQGRGRLMEKDGFFQTVYSFVAKIPVGKVATYGQLAMLSGRPRAARVVGYAMAAAPAQSKHPGEQPLPCHRVVNRLGELAPEGVFGSREYQRLLLETEGVTFLDDGRIDMKRHIWQPDAD